jgi:hypothetical protein
MRYLQDVVLATSLSLTLALSAAAQEQMSFQHWTAAPLGSMSAGPLGPSIADSVRRKVGYHHWTGAAIGAGAGAVLGSVLAFGVAGQCADCTVTTGDRAQAVLLVTGLSSAFGFLVGLASPKYVWEEPVSRLDESPQKD